MFTKDILPKSSASSESELPAITTPACCKVVELESPALTIKAFSKNGIWVLGDTVPNPTLPTWSRWIHFESSLSILNWNELFVWKRNGELMSPVIGDLINIGLLSTVSNEKNVLLDASPWICKLAWGDASPIPSLPLTVRSWDKIVLPTTWSFSDGDRVPIPTSPLIATVLKNLLLPLKNVLSPVKSGLVAFGFALTKVSGAKFPVSVFLINLLTTLSFLVWSSSPLTESLVSPKNIESPLKYKSLNLFVGLPMSKATSFAGVMLPLMSKLPDKIVSPLTWSLADGDVVPIPTSPAWSITISVRLSCLLWKNKASLNASPWPIWYPLLWVLSLFIKWIVDSPPPLDISLTLASGSFPPDTFSNVARVVSVFPVPNKWRGPMAVPVPNFTSPLTVRPPDKIVSPATWSLACGFVVPIPTLSPLVAFKANLPSCCNVISAPPLPS